MSPRGKITKLSVEQALGLAGKVEIDRLRDLIGQAKTAIEEHRGGDALRFLRLALNGPVVRFPSKAERNDASQLPCDTEPA